MGLLGGIDLQDQGPVEGVLYPADREGTHLRHVLAAGVDQGPRGAGVIGHRNLDHSGADGIVLCAGGILRSGEGAGQFRGAASRIPKIISEDLLHERAGDVVPSLGKRFQFRGGQAILGSRIDLQLEDRVEPVVDPLRRKGDREDRVQGTGVSQGRRIARLIGHRHLKGPGSQ